MISRTYSGVAATEVGTVELKPETTRDCEEDAGLTGLARSTRSKQEGVCRSSEVCTSDVEIVRLVGRRTGSIFELQTGILVVEVVSSFVYKLIRPCESN